MPRFIYWHFGSDCPKEIEKEYNRCLRYEKYQKERDQQHGVVSYNDMKLSAIVDPASTEEYTREIEQERIWERRKEILPQALKSLRQNYPKEYQLIREYFYANKVTLECLSKKYGVSLMTIKRILDRAMAHLKEYITAYENIDADLCKMEKIQK